MLKTLRFTNFKSWPEADLACGRITGLFGTNSSGKTSLLQFLLLLKQTKDATDRAVSLELNGDLVQLGTIKDAIHQHDENRSIEIGLSVELPAELALVDPSEKRTSTVARGKVLGMAAEVGVRQRAPSARRIAYTLDNMCFSLAPRTGETTQFELKASSTDQVRTKFSFKRTQGRPWQLPGPIKSYAFPDQVRTYFQNAGFLADLEAAYEAALDRVFYLGPLRDYPKRDYLWARSRPTDVGQRGEKAIDAILAATEARERRNLKPKAHLKSFQEMIAYWLHEMGLIEGFKVEEIADGSNRWQARVRTRPGASEVLLTDVGFGVSQVLPVVTLLQYVPEGATVILEQPEIHLHPLAQAGLADVLIQAAMHRRVQIILESHSEHLLLRLQRRIAEEVIPADDVKLYFCDAPKGVSKLTPLEVDLFGNIRNWPDRFMGDAFGEVAAAELKRIERRQAGKAGRMTEVIVDTNVAVVANRQNSDVVPSCVDACTTFIAKARERCIVLIDDADAIRREYAQAIRQSPPHALGALFLLHIYQHQYNGDRVRRIALPISAGGDYADFPNDPRLANFDPSDRKFAALARRTQVPVTNATDSDWIDNIAALNAHGIQINFLCGQNKASWFTP